VLGTVVIFGVGALVSRGRARRAARRPPETVFELERDA
jgi:hypothetical protein